MRKSFAPVYLRFIHTPLQSKFNATGLQNNSGKFRSLKIEMSGKKSVVHWFRKGLRVHDNPALVRAINEAINKKSVIRPIFMLDPSIVKW